MTTPAIKEAVEFEDTFLQDKIERRAYEQREKVIRDYYSYISAFKEEGLEQGMKEGLEQGLKQGLKQGLEQGLKKGLQENKIQNVVNGLKEGIDINIIAKITKVSIQDIEKIKIEFNL
jgi:predicted transposase/invertase (TIGR01784 family)